MTKKILLEIGNKEIGRYHCKEVDIPQDITEEEIEQLQNEFFDEITNLDRNRTPETRQKGEFYMNDLTVKQVDFNGAMLTAAQDKETGKIYAGVKWMCKGIGLTDGQYQNETRKIQTELVLKQGIANLQLPTKGGKQEVLCIELNYLPLWLAKISITPKMQEEQPELTERLIEYQLKAKDVLADAFIKENQCGGLSPELQIAKLLFDAQAKSEIRINNIEKRLDAIESQASTATPEAPQKTYYTSTEIANSHGISTVALHKFLYDRNVIYPNGKAWKFYKAHAGKKLGTIKGKSKTAYSIIHWTDKGKQFIDKLLTSEA